MSISITSIRQKYNSADGVLLTGVDKKSKKEKVKNSVSYFSFSI